MRTKDPINLVKQLAGSDIEYEYRLEVFRSSEEAVSLEVNLEMIKVAFDVCRQLIRLH
jgi:hypothetical protein